MRFKLMLPAAFFLSLLFFFFTSPALFADEIPAGTPDQGTIGGDAGGARVDPDAKGIEDALREQGIITGGDAGGNGGPPVLAPNVHTEKMPDGSTRTVTNHPDGSRTIETTDRQSTPRNMTQTFDKDGHVVSQIGEHSDGTMDTMSYDPETGVRTSTRTEPDGRKTVSVSQKDGSSTITQTGFSADTTVTTEDAEGRVTRTTTRPDGSKTVETFTRVEHDPYARDGQPVTTTTTEYDASGKPVKTVSSTTVRRGTGYAQTRREETEYDDRGKPVKTTVTEPGGPYGNWITVEEVEYWGNGFRKIIKRRNADGEITEIYYYDELGKLKESSIKPGHTAGEPPSSGAWYESPAEEKPRTPRPEPVAREEDPFGDNVGTPELNRFGRALGREMTFGGDQHGGENHPHPQEHWRE